MWSLSSPIPDVNVVMKCTTGVSVYQRGREPLHIPAVSIKPVDTNGAGDTFATTFMIQLANGMSIEDAGMSATWAASRVRNPRSFPAVECRTQHQCACDVMPCCGFKAHSIRFFLQVCLKPQTCKPACCAQAVQEADEREMQPQAQHLLPQFFKLEAIEESHQSDSR